MRIPCIFVPTACLTLGLLAVTLSSPATAGVMTIGDVELVDAPESVLRRETVSYENMFAFAERESVVLGDDLAVDITTPGTFGELTQLTPGVIAAGTRVSSFVMLTSFELRFYIPEDPFPFFPTPVFAAGSLVFTSDQPILGVMVHSSTLLASDAIVGFSSNSGATFIGYGGTSRGLELLPDGRDLNGIIGMNDIVNVSADRRSVTLALATNFDIDQIRIIVGVPEPSSVALLGLALIGLAGWRRRTQ